MRTVSVKVVSYMAVILTDAEEMMMTMCYQHNEKIAAIKVLRANRSGNEPFFGLKEAKETVDFLWDEMAEKNYPKHWSTKYRSESDANNKKPETLGEIFRRAAGIESNGSLPNAGEEAIETQGYKAQAAGKDLVRDNPYSESRDVHWAWRRGFLDAVRDSK